MKIRKTNEIPSTIAASILITVPQLSIAIQTVYPILSEP